MANENEQFIHEIALSLIKGESPSEISNNTILNTLRRYKYIVLVLNEYWDNEKFNASIPNPMNNNCINDLDFR